MLPDFPLKPRLSFASGAIALLLFVFAACSDDPNEVVPPKKNTLDAQAGDDQSVLVHTPVVVDASGSKGGNGTPFDIAWTLKSKPTGSVSVLDNPTAIVSGFTPDKPGIYKVSLTIKEGAFTDTDELWVTVTATDDPDEPQTILIDTNISEERALEDIFTDPLRPDYIVTENITVTSLLSVQPGVVIEFEQDKGMQVMHGGALVAEGTPARPITFTGVMKQNGYWKGLMFATNNDLNLLSYTIVEYGGSSEHLESPLANVSVPGDGLSGSVLRISHSTIRHSGKYGLYVGGMSFLAEFSEMTFNANAGTAIYCSPKNISNIEPNTLFLGNGFDGVETGGVLNEGSPVLWPPLANGKYRVSSDLTIASTLEIASGAVFQMEKSVLITVSESGSVTAHGTFGTSIVFEGTSTVPENGWRGILFRSSQENSLDHAIVRNAGYAELPGLTGIRANIGVATGAKLSLTNSLMDRSSGWGVALAEGSYFNEDIHTSNDFISVAQGSVKFPRQPHTVSITGEWVEFSSFIANASIDVNFYNRQTGEWFGGADNPWAMLPQTGFGLKVDASGRYVWTIAIQHSPMTECFTYSAEHFTGIVTADGEFLNFTEESWRSKYFNSCAPEEGMDIEIEPGKMQLPYEMTTEYHPSTGEQYTVLSITSGGETFKLYKR